MCHQDVFDLLKPLYYNYIFWAMTKEYLGILLSALFSCSTDNKLSSIENLTKLITMWRQEIATFFIVSNIIKSIVIVTVYAITHMQQRLKIEFHVVLMDVMSF